MDSRNFDLLETQFELAKVCNALQGAIKALDSDNPEVSEKLAIASQSLENFMNSVDKILGVDSSHG